MINQTLNSLHSNSSNHQKWKRIHRLDNGTLPKSNAAGDDAFSQSKLSHCQLGLTNWLTDTGAWCRVFFIGNLNIGPCLSHLTQCHVLDEIFIVEFNNRQLHLLSVRNLQFNSMAMQCPQAQVCFILLYNLVWALNVLSLHLSLPWTTNRLQFAWDLKV